MKKCKKGGLVSEKLEIYKCNICGNVVQILFAGNGELVCCGKPMEHLQAQYEENNELAEKHIPVIEKSEGCVNISLPNHPMVPEHYIQIIEAYSKDKTKLYLKYFNSGDVPEMKLSCSEDIEALELCNIHGLWRSSND